MFINEDYSNYKYLIEAHDNFVILSTSKGIYGESGDADIVPCYYQYFSPSFYGFESTYRSYDTFTFNDISSFFDTDISSRADFPLIFICSFIFVIICVFIFNNLSRLFKKGGVFGGLS